MGVIKEALSQLPAERQRAIENVLSVQVRQPSWQVPLEEAIGVGADFMGEIENGAMATELQKEVACLPEDILKEVVILRFGLDTGESRTLQEVGYMLGMSGERVRQRESKALRFLRQPSRPNKLYDFLTR